MVGVLLGRHLGPLGAALACCAALALRRVFQETAPERLGPILCLIPASLGAIAPRPTSADLQAGARPVQLTARVVGRARAGFENDTARIELELVDAAGHPRGGLRGTLRGVDAALVAAPLPGDLIRGPAWLDDPARAARLDRPPHVTLDRRALVVTSGGGVDRHAEAVRRRLAQALLQHVPDRRNAALLCHLVLGQGPRLDPQLVQAHRETGLAHLLAVSGAHLSLLAAMLVRLSGPQLPGTRRVRRRRLALRVLLIGYAALTGFDPPVLRALIAWLILDLASVRGRRAGIVAALAAPALLTALCFPDSFLGPSFCLSYAAVLGLWATGGVDPEAPDAGWSLRRVFGASAWATLTTAPLTLLWFGQIAPWTLLGTPLLGPLVAAMLGLGLVTALLAFLLPDLAALLGVALDAMASTYCTAVSMLAELPGAPVHALAVPAPATLWATALLGALVVALGRTRRHLAWACALTCLPYFVPLHDAAHTSPPTLTLLDVGHGQAALLVAPDGARVVVDCGSARDGELAARAVERALPPGPRRIDLLVLSHGDADHHNGIEGLLGRVPVTAAVVPEHVRGTRLERLLRDAGVTVDWLAPGTRRSHCAGRIRIDAPAPAGDVRGRNDLSLWTRVDLDGTTVLLAGDAEAAGMDAMRELAGDAACCDLLVLPHHGRGPPEPFRRLVARLDPGGVLCSRGEEPRPALETASLAAGLAVWSTAESGDLRVVGGPAPRIEGTRPAPIPRRPR